MRSHDQSVHAGCERVLITMPRPRRTDRAPTWEPWVSLADTGDELLALPLLRTAAPSPFAEIGAVYTAIVQGAPLGEDNWGAYTRAPAGIPLSLKHAAPRRLATYAAGRWCAARALEALGHRLGTPVGVGADGAPVWPEGFAGSITHTGHLAAAVAAPRGVIRGVGIDCEAMIAPDQVAGLRSFICSEWEAAPSLCGDSALTESQRLTAVFSAKESLYKCLQPLVGTFFEFFDVHVVRVDPDGSMRFRLMRDLNAEFGRGMEFDARFEIGNDLVFTAVILRGASPFRGVEERGGG